MPTLKKPWLSLALLLVTYSTLGWLLSAFHNPWFVWVIIVVGILLLAAALSSPRAKFKDSSRLFKSNTKNFFFVIAAAFLSAILLWRLQIFVHALVIISAATLFRLDAQTARLSNKQIFWILVIVSLAGLGLGLLAQTVIYVNS